jgi:hypothetical protein
MVMELSLLNPICVKFSVIGAKSVQSWHKDMRSRESLTHVKHAEVAKRDRKILIRNGKEETPPLVRDYTLILAQPKGIDLEALNSEPYS